MKESMYNKKGLEILKEQRSHEQEVSDKIYWNNLGSFSSKRISLLTILIEYQETCKIAFEEGYI